MPWIIPGPSVLWVFIADVFDNLYIEKGILLNIFQTN